MISSEMLLQMYETVQKISSQCTKFMSQLGDVVCFQLVHFLIHGSTIVHLEAVVPCVWTGSLCYELLRKPAEQPFDSYMKAAVPRNNTVLNCKDILPCEITLKSNLRDLLCSWQQPAVVSMPRYGPVETARPGS